MTNGYLFEYVIKYINRKEDTDAVGTDERYLNAAREMLKFMDEIPGGFLIYRAQNDEEIIYANQALINIFGCKDLKEFREHTGNSFRGLVYDSDLEAVENAISEQIAHNADKLDYVEYRIRRKDGALRWVEDYGHFIHSEAVGDIYYVFISDVTEQKQRRLAETAAIVNEKEQKIKNLTEAYNKELKLINQEHLRRLEVIEGLSVNYESILYVDLTENKLLPYRASVRMKDNLDGIYQPRDYRKYIERYVDTWVFPEDRNSVRESIGVKGLTEKLKNNNTFFLNYRVLGENSVTHMQLRVVNVGAGSGVSQIVIGARNIEEEIVRDRKQMQMLEDALNASKRANVAKNTFLSNMSHDMRTPLNAIFGYTALAKNCVDEAARVYLDKIDSSGKQLLELIDKVLQIAQLESGEFTIAETECSLSQICQNVKHSVWQAAADKNVDVITDTGNVHHDRVICDGDKLEQVLIHIADNAVTYSEYGGKVQIAVNETQDLHNGYSVYRIDVTDNGIGIDGKYTEHIFEPFERIKNTTHSGVHGTGLGLTISKRFVEAMGGKISVKSRLGKGSTFSVTLTLPAAKVEMDLTETTESLLNKIRGKKILVVDDNEINMEIETEILLDLGFDVDTANDGDIAVEKMQSAAAKDYAVIIMDIQMPRMDGRTATRMIRSLTDKSAASVPIIALSANAFESDKKLSKESGVDEHLSKPVDVSLLLKTMFNILRLKNR
ncbi:MAG: ATP-binding protein [Corallococcus sp.]|nr:ATP-binding protein [Corallococcus sp.]